MNEGPNRWMYAKPVPKAIVVGLKQEGEIAPINYLFEHRYLRLHCYNVNELGPNSSI